ncbi:MAG TPA: thioredoxin [Acidimicrobiales bacterium]|jgi:thioredoxin 1
MTAAVLDLTESSFDEEIAGSDVPVLVEFWAPWCAPCRAMAPIIETLADDLGGSLRVRKINADENPELARRYQVAAVPSFLIFHEGAPVRTMTGARSRAQLLAELEEFVP